MSDRGSSDLLASGCLLRRAGPPQPLPSWDGVTIHDDRFAALVDPKAELLVLYDQMLHGEGPVWQRDRLIFSDIPGRRVMAWHPDGHVSVAIDAVPFVNGNALDRDGSLVHCEHGRRAISRSVADGFPQLLATHFEGRRLNTPNDIAVTADGAIWFTDPIFGLLFPRQGCLGETELDHRSLYRLTRDGQLHRMADFDQPNGLAFSPDEKRLYVTDTSRSIGGATHDVIAFDVGQDGALSGRRLFCQSDHGVPDGILVDCRHWLWSTAGDGLHVFDDNGECLAFIPTSQTASNLTFGGFDGCRLFVTAETHLLALDLKSEALAS